MEEGISSEDNLSSTVLHEPADAILCMAWGVESLDRDVADFETFAILWSLCYTLAILASDDRLSLELRMS